MIRNTLIALFAAASVANASVVFRGSIDGPADVDRYTFRHPAGDLAASIASDATLTPAVGLFDGRGYLLAITGPGEPLYAQGVAAGVFTVVITGEGRGGYALTVPGGSAVVPEPSFGVLAAVVMVLLAMVFGPRVRRRGE